MTKVTKRDGTTEELNIDKIHKVLDLATEGLNNVFLTDVEVNAQLLFYDGIPTSEIHNNLVKSASDLISLKNPDYQYVAARLLLYKLRKDVWGESQAPRLWEHIKRCTDLNIYDKSILKKYTKSEILKLGKYLDHSRDNKFTYAGLAQCINKYLVKNRKTGQVYETPQFVFMMIAMTLFSKYPKDKRIEFVQKAYDAISLFKINLPSPILSGVRTNTTTFSSCTLINVDDTLDSIFASSHAVARYTASRSGIGLNVGKIRSMGSGIRDYEETSTGLIPFLKVMEASVKSCTQSGTRRGAATVNIQLWHHEIRDVVVLKNNAGTDDNRVRKMDYCVAFDRLFFERLRDKKDITLFSPHEVKDLYKKFGTPEFKAEYEKCEKDESLNRVTIPAIELASLYLKERVETNRIYAMFIDNVNSQGSFKEKVEMTNLCVAPETLLLTEYGQIPIAELDGETVKIWNGEEWSESLVKKTSDLSKLYKVTLSDGKELYCTDYHKWSTIIDYNSERRNRFKEKTTLELKAGDRLQKTKSFPIIDNDKKLQHPYTIGFLTADGTVDKKGYKIIDVYGDKVNCIVRMNVRSRWDNESKECVTVSVDCDGLKFEVPMDYCLDTKLRWLEGYLDGDGHIAINGENQSIQVCSIEYKFLQELQLMLQTIGIDSKIIDGNEERINTFYRKKTGEPYEANCKKNWRLLITSNGLYKLSQLGFKTNRLKFNERLPQRDAKQYVRIVSVEDVGRYDETYCVGEPKKNMAIFNGVLTKNCCEILQPVKSIQDINDKEGMIGLCTLSSINLLETSDEEVESVCDIVVRMLDELLDYQSYPLPAVKNFVDQYRSLGVGVTNLFGLLAREKMRHGSQESLELIDEKMERIAYYLTKTSIDLAKEKEPCKSSKLTYYSDGVMPIDRANENAKKLVKRKPSMDWDKLRKRAKRYGIRNATLMAEAPNEASSLIHNSTNGMEPPRDFLVKKFAKQIVPLYETHSQYYTLSFECTNKNITDMAATMQKWIDMGMSTNQYYDPNRYDDGIPVSELLHDLIYSWKMGMKTLYYCNTKGEDTEACEGGACSL